MVMLLACAEPPSCAEGYAAEGDGYCVTRIVREDPEHVDAGDFLAVLPACEPETGDGRIRPGDPGCADPVCAGLTYAEMNDVVGHVGACEIWEYPFLDDLQYLECAWSAGFFGYFDDDDLDGAPDAGGTTSPLTVEAPYAGTTSDGLGVGTAASCFVDAWGPPDGVIVEDGRLSDLYWPSAAWIELAEDRAIAIRL